MPRITPGNRLYFYLLFQREIGFGNQVRITTFADVLAADDVDPADCGCETADELLESLGDFLKITTFKKGRVFCTLQQSPDLDEMLARSQRAADDKDVRAGKSWKRKRAGKIVKPAKPRHKKKPAEKSEEPQPEPTTEPELSPAPQADATPEPTTEAEATTEDEATAEQASGSEPPSAPAPEDATKTETANAEEGNDGEGGKTGEGELASEGDQAQAAPAPGINLTITYDPRKDESLAHLYVSEDELPAKGSFSFEEGRKADAEEVVEGEPSLLSTIGIPESPEVAIADQSGLPKTISADVACKDAMLGLLYEVLPPDVDPMAALDEGWLVARSTSRIAGTRASVTFPLRYVSASDGLPVEVTVAHTARTASGKRWELAAVCGVREPGDAGWDALAPADAPSGAAPSAGVLVSWRGQSADPERELARTVHLGSWETALAALADVSAPEPWALPGEEGEDGHGMLRAYVASTFRRIVDQDRLALAQDGTLAAFDTGLSAPCGERVLALLSATDDETPWRLEGFLSEGAGMLGEGVAERFDTPPARASYVDDARMMALAPMATVDADARMLARKCVRDANGEGREGGLGETLRDAELLGRAIERAVERARVDARLAVPAYDGGTGTVYLLLPLCEEGSLRATCALVLELDEEVRSNEVVGWPQAHYRAVALAPLGRARACARVVTSELPRWLAPREATDEG